MNFKGTVTINAPREKVWAFLTDPSKLTECVPGLESLDVIVPMSVYSPEDQRAYAAARQAVSGAARGLRAADPDSP